MNEVMAILKRIVAVGLQETGFEALPIEGTSLLMKRNDTIISLTDQGYGDLDWVVYISEGPIIQDRSPAGYRGNPSVPQRVFRISPKNPVLCSVIEVDANGQEIPVFDGPMTNMVPFLLEIL